MIAKMVSGIPPIESEAEAERLLETLRSNFYTDLKPHRARGTINTMSDAPTREEIDAKLAAAEARTETRFVSLEHKIDRLADVITGEHGILAEMRGLKADNHSTRVTVVVTVIAGILSAAALVVSVQSTLLSAFQAGLASHPPASPAPPGK